MIPSQDVPQTDESPSTPRRTRLDPLGILIAPTGLFLVWLIEVVVFNRDQLPGIICLTPMMWLLALVIGRGVVTFSRSRQTGDLSREAAIAGAFFGTMIGGLYLVDILFVGKGDPGTATFAL